MNLITKLFAAAALATASMSAHAVQADITVWADIDPTLALLKADGTPLSDVVELGYRAGSGTTAGLVPWTDQVRVFSNDITKDITVRLGSAPSLIPTMAGPTATAVPLSVHLNSVAVTVGGVDFTAASLFPGSNYPGASIVLPLTISQTTAGPIAVAGRYEGIVSLVMVQKP
ncbi:CS1 type fimbrial major subunit [Stenotrophomonas sp. Ker107b]